MAGGKQVVVTALREALARGDLAPGQRLVEAELAEAYGAGRAGVRAALIELAAEGLLERIPNRGARVRVVSVEEAIAITECRMVLEGLCAARAAGLATEEDDADLLALAESLRTAVGDPMRYAAANRELHLRIRKIAAHPVAEQLLERLNAQLVRHQFRLALRPGRPQTSLAEHLAVVEAIVARDPGRAEAAARAHLAGVISALADRD